MAKIGHVPEIIEVKRQLEQLAADGAVSRWELPYENILTRLDAALFYVEFSAGREPDEVWRKLSGHGDLCFGANTDHTLSTLPYWFGFGSPEKE
jgi:hypothetical protein